MGRKGLHAASAVGESLYKLGEQEKNCFSFSKISEDCAACRIAWNRFSQCLGLGDWGYSCDVCGMANHEREKKVIFPNVMFGGESLIGTSHVAVKAVTWNSQLTVSGVSGSSLRSMVNQRG